MESNEVVLLSRQGNTAVVHLPGRQYPGVVIQGDSLSILHALVREARELCPAAPTKDGADDTASLLDDVEERLRDYLTMYEAVLKERHIPLPYAEAISGEGDGE
ncbi:hypothetical protein OV208_28720 [Corallococcus sp. bb12-1]|uniref:DUF6959 family protein n=1 Tax=Corallococcus sp. bb12-1 TaxID=2996784 RepID=UPI00226DE4F3|nr:hypothetical protein [Corallococcus sp. bb12-1]MCY1045334.1 hypothetical protein [Corallococcus sp. bb12-1]